MAAMPQYDYLRTERDGDVLTIWLNRPEEGNAMLAPMHHEFIDLLRRLQADSELRVVILTGTGDVFSARRDETFAAWAKDIDTKRQAFALTIPFYIRIFIQTMLDVEVPIIGAINGNAFGIGATVALFCDITVMDENAKIADKHTRYGVVAGDGGQVVWPLLVGPNRAKDLLMRGVEIDAERAERMGLVNYVAPAGGSLAMAREIANDLLGLAPWAVRLTKSAVNQQIRAQFQNAMPLGAALEALTITSEDHAEAVKAIAEMRTPQFKGK